MTKDKAQKRAVRARMTKTGEAYTTARHYLLDEHRSESTRESQVAPEPAAARGASSLPPRVADPGMSDQAVQRNTGMTWDEIFVKLDAWGATAHNHTEIARYVSEGLGIGSWWAQTVTVGYERARGLRKVHEHVDGFSVSVSKTFAVPIEVLFTHFADDEQRGRWIEPDVIKPRSSTANKAWRGEAVADGSRMEARFTAKSADKTAVAIEHMRLPSEEDVATWRAFWKERLERLAASLA